MIAGDGPISWTSIADLGLASALVLVDSIGKFEGKTFYLASLETRTLRDVARIVSEVKGPEIEAKVTGKDEYVEYYVGSGRERSSAEWWVSSYEALKRGECEIQDTTFSELLGARGTKPKPVEEGIREMLAG